jgi:molybdopterin-guanine dinucleotide biosynthesis protein A
MSLRAALVLAGGQSTRMGRDKAMLPWHGRPLLDHMIGLAREAGIDHVYVSGDRPGYRSIPDLEPGLGPLGGLASAGAALPDGRLLVLAVDMPRLTPGLLRALMDDDTHWRAHDGCVCHEGAPLPMVLELRRDTRTAITDCLATGGRGASIRALQQRIGTHVLATTPAIELMLANGNTPAEWEALSS